MRLRTWGDHREIVLNEIIYVRDFAKYIGCAIAECSVDDKCDAKSIAEWRT